MAAKQPHAGMEIKVKYTRAPDMRDIHADGVYGSVSSKGHIFMAVYSERQELPETATLSVVADPNKPGALKVDDKPDFTGRNERVIHAVLNFDVDLARALRKWLDDKIEVFDRQVQE